MVATTVLILASFAQQGSKHQAWTQPKDNRSPSLIAKVKKQKRARRATYLRDLPMAQPTPQPLGLWCKCNSFD